jgi:hypothetical protein
MYINLKKYGYESFNLEILEYCDPSQCIAREDYYLELLEPKYNLCKKAGNSTGRVLSEETRLKISASHKGLKAGQNNPNFGKTYSDEEKLNILLSSPNRIKIEVTDLGEAPKITTTYNSLREASRAINCDKTSISRYLKSNSQNLSKGDILYHLFRARGALKINSRQSNNLNNISFASSKKPGFISGFSDGECSFIISIYKRANKTRTG